MYLYKELLFTFLGMYLKHISSYLLKNTRKSFFLNEDMSDLEGQQTGVVTKALVKVVPCSISNSWQQKIG